MLKKCALESERNNDSALTTSELSAAPTISPLAGCSSEVKLNSREEEIKHNCDDELADSRLMNVNCS